MPKFKWLVQTEVGWAQFGCGFCCDQAIATAQLSLFAAQYPDRLFTFIEVS